MGSLVRILVAVERVAVGVVGAWAGGGLWRLPHCCCSRWHAHRLGSAGARGSGARRCTGEARSGGYEQGRYAHGEADALALE